MHTHHYATVDEMKCISDFHYIWSKNLNFSKKQVKTLSSELSRNFEDTSLVGEKTTFLIRDNACMSSRSRIPIRT